MKILSQKIRQKIDENNKRINSILRPDVFVLNEEVKELLDENRKLQQECKHRFENGVCIYCDKEEAL